MIARPRGLVRLCRRRVAAIAACTNPLARQYEYEEQLYLKVDGRATVVVDSSLPALVAPARRIVRSVDRTDPPIAQPFGGCIESAGCPVDSVSRFWERRGRRFVQIQISVRRPADADVMRSACLVHVLVDAASG